MHPKLTAKLVNLQVQEPFARRLKNKCTYSFSLFDLQKLLYQLKRWKLEMFYFLFFAFIYIYKC